MSVVMARAGWEEFAKYSVAAQSECLIHNLYLIRWQGVEKVLSLCGINL